MNEEELRKRKFPVLIVGGRLYKEGTQTEEAQNRAARLGVEPRRVLLSDPERRVLSTISCRPEKQIRMGRLTKKTVGYDRPVILQALGGLKELGLVDDQMRFGVDA